MTWFKINKSQLISRTENISVKYLSRLEKYQCEKHIILSTVPRESGQPYGGECLLWESRVGGVGISGILIVSKFDFFNKFLSFSEAECISLEDGRCVTGLDKISR